MAQVQLILGFIAVTLSFTAGWTVHDWKVGSEKVAVKKTEAVISKLLEDKLKDLKANERVIRHEVEKIIERPVYLNDCLDADGVLLVNMSKSGTTEPAR
jgi:uncharacterized protein YdeI (YjbR/CyaY-like superfamily)